MDLQSLTGHLSDALSPSPLKESIFFWFGALVLSRLLNFRAQNADTDSTETPAYYWLVVPIGFVVAAVTIYKKSNLYRHWFFGFHFFVPLSTYFIDLLFGITIGLIFTSGPLRVARKKFFENFSKWLKNIQLGYSWSKEELLARLGRIPEVRAMPDFWDRFKPESQIKTLETFLREIDNVTDRNSLEFWKHRQDDTYDDDFNFRLSFNEKSLAKLNFQEIKSKDYLAIEFWKAKDGSFRIRTTDESQREPREFKDVTPVQRSELEPHIEYWYSKLK